MAYVCVQIAVAARWGQRHLVPRLLAALGFLFALALVGGPAHAVPLILLALPIVATAARYGRQAALVVGVAAVSLPLIASLARVEEVPVVLARGSAFLATMLLLAIGTRLTVEAMEAAVGRARTSMSPPSILARSIRGSARPSRT